MFICNCKPVSMCGDQRSMSSVFLLSFTLFWRQGFSLTGVCQPAPVPHCWGGRCATPYLAFMWVLGIQTQHLTCWASLHLSAFLLPPTLVCCFESLAVYIYSLSFQNSLNRPDWSWTHWETCLPLFPNCFVSILVCHNAKQIFFLKITFSFVVPR